MNIPTEKAERNLKATWSQALAAFLLPVLIILGARWLLIEPYVIPSGSMIPTLLIHDHIFVNKLAYGLRWPFSKTWIVRWAEPKRGEVVVFHYPKDPEVFFVKRVIGLPGDKIKVLGTKLFVNSMEVLATEREFAEADEAYVYYQEGDHIVRHRFESLGDSGEQEFEVPDGQLFVMGDNRDESSDSRVWGFVPVSFVVGRGSMIWLACQDTLPSAPYICDPQKLRLSRVLTIIR